MTLFDRIRDEARTLADLYAYADNLVLDRPGANHGSTRAGKPASKEPAGVDRTLQSALVRSARAVADAHYALAGLGVAVWTPSTLGRRWVEAVADLTDTDTGETVTPRFITRWAPDPDSLRPPSPQVIQAACHQLTAVAGYASTRDDARSLGKALAAVQRAVKALTEVEKIQRLTVQDGQLVTYTETVGVAVPAHYPRDDERCRNFPASCHELREAGRPECHRCRKARYAANQAAKEQEKARRAAQP